MNGNNWFERLINRKYIFIDQELLSEIRKENISEKLKMIIAFIYFDAEKLLKDPKRTFSNIDFIITMEIDVEKENENQEKQKELESLKEFIKREEETLLKVHNSTKGINSFPTLQQVKEVFEKHKIADHFDEEHLTNNDIEFIKIEDEKQTINKKPPVKE